MGTLNTQDEHISAYPRSNIFLEVESRKRKKETETKKNIKKLLQKAVLKCITACLNC